MATNFPAGQPVPDYIPEDAIGPAQSAALEAAFPNQPYYAPRKGNFTITPSMAGLGGDFSAGGGGSHAHGRRGRHASAHHKSTHHSSHHHGAAGKSTHHRAGTQAGLAGGVPDTSHTPKHPRLHHKAHLPALHTTSHPRKKRHIP